MSYIGTLDNVFFFQVGFGAIAEALGLAAVKAAVAITAIIAGGRLVSFTSYSFINYVLGLHHNL